MAKNEPQKPEKKEEAKPKPTSLDEMSDAEVKAAQAALGAKGTK